MNKYSGIPPFVNQIPGSDPFDLHITKIGGIPIVFTDSTERLAYTASIDDCVLQLSPPAIYLYKNDSWNLIGQPADGTGSMSGPVTGSDVKNDSSVTGSSVSDALDYLLSQSGSSITFATADEVRSGSVTDKAIAPSSLLLRKVGDAIFVGDDVDVARGQYSLDIQTVSAGVTGSKSSAFGYKNKTYGNGSSAFGYFNITSGSESTAVGFSNITNGVQSCAIGFRNTSIDNSTSVGCINTSSAQQSSTFGYGNNSSGISSVSVGYRNTSNGLKSSALGYRNTSIGDNSSAFGYSNTTNGAYSSAFGYSNTTNGAYSSAFGYNNVVSGSNSSAFGYNNTINYDNCFSAGKTNNVSGGEQSSAIGISNFVSGSKSSAFGYNNVVSGSNSSAFGYSNTTNGAYSSAFGSYNISNGNNSSTFGRAIKTTVDNSQEFGYWVDNTTRVSSVRLNGTGDVSLTIVKTDTPKTDGGTTAGSELDGTLMRSGISFRVSSSNELIIEYNDAGTIKTAVLGTLA